MKKATVEFSGKAMGGKLSFKGIAEYDEIESSTEGLAKFGEKGITEMVNSMLRSSARQAAFVEKKTAVEGEFVQKIIDAGLLS